MGAVRTRSFSDVLDQLELEAVRDHSIPRSVIVEARRATLRAVGDGSGAKHAFRARSYFWAVIRRSAARHVTLRDLSDRFVLAAAAEDLRQVERRPEEVWNQLRRDWTGRVPDHVLEEFGRRLCA